MGHYNQSIAGTIVLLSALASACCTSVQAQEPTPGRPSEQSPAAVESGRERDEYQPPVVGAPDSTAGGATRGKKETPESAGPTRPMGTPIGGEP